jgi:hypothetical protein
MVNFSISNILDKKLNLNELKLKLKYYKIIVKEYKGHENNLLLLYRNYNSSINNAIERECRSIIINEDNYQIVAYSCPNPIIVNNFKKIAPLQKIINKYYEGTYLTIFYYNNKWNISSRKFLNEGNHYELFLETIDNINFFNNLNIDKIYNFILIHFKDKQIIDYTELFGNDYKKLCLTSIRDKEMNEEKIDLNIELFNNVIFLPEIVDYSDCYNNLFDSSLIVKSIEENKIYKIKSNNINLFDNNKNIYIGYIYLYQINKLEKNIKLKSYNVLGIISLIFKILTDNIYKLFTFYYNNGNHNNNNNSYHNLNKEYKNVLYFIRGIYFTNNLQCNDCNFIKNKIYNYLKNIDTIILYNFIKLDKNLCKNKMINDFIILLTK